MPASVISAPVRSVINTTILVGLGVLLLTVIFGVLCCTECVLEALDGAACAIEAIANGDLTVRAPIRSKDELGRMAESVNHMVESLNTLTAAAAQTADRVNESAGSLAATSQETSASVEELTSQSNEIATMLKSFTMPLRILQAVWTRFPARLKALPLTHSFWLRKSPM